jgi:hypothetical protein
MNGHYANMCHPNVTVRFPHFLYDLNEILLGFHYFVCGTVSLRDKILFLAIGREGTGLILPLASDQMHDLN